MAISSTSAIIKLEADVAQFNAGMRSAGLQTEQAMKQMKKDAEMVGAAIGAMAVVGAGAMFVMARRAIDSADGLAKMSQKTGLAVEQLSQLQHAADLSGVGNESLEKSIRLLNISVAEGLAGDKLRIEAFKSLGITTADLGKGTQEVMMKMADAYSKAKDGAGKVAVGNVLMGKSSTDMIPLLNGGRIAIMDMMTEADKLGLTVSTDFSKSAEEFNDNLSRIETLSTRLAISLGGDLVDGLGKAMKAMADATIKGGALAGVIAGIQTLLTGDDRHKNNVAMVEQTEKLMLAENQLAKQRAKAAGDSWGSSLAKENLPSYQKAVENVKAELAVTQGYRKMMDDEDAKAQAVVDAVKAAREKAEEIRLAKIKAAGAKDPAADFKAYMKNLEGQISKTQELTAVEKLLNDIRSGSLTVNANQEKTLTWLAAAIDKEKEVVQTLKMKRDAAVAVADAINKGNEEYQRQAAQTTANVENIRIGLMSELGQETLAHELRLQELQKFHDVKLENVMQANALIEAENARHTKTLMEIQAAKDIQSVSMAGSAASDLYSIMEKSGNEQSALGKALFFANKALAVTEIIMNTNLAATKVEGQTGLFGLPMAAFVMAQGYSRAAMVAGLAISGAREKGGPVWGGGAFLVGEKGPEIFQPSGHGTIIPNSQLGGGGDMKLTIVNNTSAPIGRVTEQRISPTERALLLEEATRATAASFSDPNSVASKSLNRNFTINRSR